MPENTEPAVAAEDDATTRRVAAHVRGRSHRAEQRGFAGWLAGMSVRARWVVIAAGALVAVTLLAVGVDIASSAGRVHPGVRVAGVAVGGMTRIEAARRIDSGIKPLLERPVKVSLDAESWDLTAAQIGASVDATRLAAAAYGIGRGTDVVSTISERFSAWFGRQDVALAVTPDEVLLSAVLGDIDKAVGVAPVDASVEVSGTAVRLVPATEGKGIDRTVARGNILAAFASNDRSVSLALVPRPASITEDGARAAYDTARKMVSAPLTLTYDKKRWEVPGATVGGWLAFRSAGATETAGAVAGTLECYLDSAEVSASVVPLVKEVGKVAQDASFKVSSGTVSIVPAQDGLGVDAEDLATRLMQALTGSGERVVELPMKRVAPAITTDAAKGMGITTRLSTYTTSYASSNKPRVNNIHLLADALDGTLIAPGAVFSFNGTIGPRTAAKGYQEANAIVNGKLVPQLGGGVCQIGTTIFNTVFFSGLPVVERHNHSLYISHYPKGRDATVSWGGPDFQFRNDTGNWVLVATSYSNSTVTVSLYGTTTGYKVAYTTGAFTNTVAFPVREIKDATLPKGTKVVEEKGVSGRSIVVSRTVTKNGVVIHKDSFKSVYKPAEEVVRVGTKVSAPSTPPTSTP